ncbi:MAG: peptidoglycan-associated lipoprotein Pal [Gammaproteobacteria bacterium]|nr:MAG: peptidoglycan-associated lipoprotein Pal [Gammaproteobacteria bacterium]RLA12937.1 MAG: peptidoglycan-associated lipoprotein Pal [Gammaproteobacteria bacterium]RLA16013.1 MAG: peptidoglycan-associated lipoprotein Pal [Gammaproteobacteria bacterium]
MIKNLTLISALFAGVLLAGCSTTTGPGVDSDAGSTATGSDVYGSSSAATSGTGMDTGFSSLPLDSIGGGAGGEIGSKTIYFDFDSYHIQAEYQPVVAVHAAYLASNPTARVNLQGHTDERGSREYNMALGERRGDSVANLFLAAGAADNQLYTVAYGEESPVADCHDETCWSQNRRVVIEYTAQ